MTTMEIGKKLVELCKQGKNHEATETLYSNDICSVEAQSMPNMPAVMQGIKAIGEKGKWWADNHTIHSASIDGPYPNGDRFIVKFNYDVTNKQSNQRFKMEEMALFTVQNNKIVREEFFYTMG
jgi:hypothetical protein